MFELLDHGSDVNVVQIFNADGTRLLATIQTIAAERRQATGDTEVRLAEAPFGEPDAVLQLLSMFDGNSKQLIWRGTSTSDLSGNPEKNAKKLDTDIHKMFKQFQFIGKLISCSSLQKRHHLVKSEGVVRPPLAGIGKSRDESSGASLMWNCISV